MANSNRIQTVFKAADYYGHGRIYEEYLRDHQLSPKLHVQVCNQDKAQITKCMGRKIFPNYIMRKRCPTSQSLVQ